MNETQTLIATNRTSGEMAGAAAASHAKALVEAKYIMAMQRPRNILAVRDKILDACARPAFAEKAWYSKPTGDGRVRGPSIRFAETAIQCMMNISVMPTIVYEDAEKIVLDVQVIDLESNTSYGDQVTLTKSVERRDKTGRKVLSERVNKSNQVVYIVEATDDEMANKVNSAKSKVIRNSGLRLIPHDIIEEAETAVRATLEKGGSDPAEAKKRMADEFSFIGIKPAELEKYLGHSLDSISPAEVADLREVYAALKDGEAKWSDYVDKGVKRTSTPARTEPHDPFKDPMGTQTAPVVEENPLDDSALTDFLSMVDECPDAANLNNLAKNGTSSFTGAKLEMAKSAIRTRAATLNLTWNSKQKAFA